MPNLLDRLRGKCFLFQNVNHGFISCFSGTFHASFGGNVLFDQLQHGHIAALDVDSINQILLNLSNLLPQGQVLSLASRELVRGFQSPGIQEMGFVKNIVVFVDIPSIGVLAFSVPQNSVFVISAFFTHVLSPFIEKAPNMTYKQYIIVRS